MASPDSDAAAGYLEPDALQWLSVTMYSHIAYNYKLSGKNTVDSCSA